MINSTDLRGSQAMINEMIKNKIKLVSILKWLLVISAFSFVIHFPDVFGHSLLWMVHTFYEATSFLLENFLVHTFNFDKALAQLIVFYFSIIVGIVATILFWRNWLRDYLVFKFYAYKHEVVYFWHSKRTFERIKLLLIYSSLIISTFMLLIS